MLLVTATKSPDGLIDWIELKPEFYCSIVKCILRLASKHTAKFKSASAKEALFQFLINLLNGRATCTAFFHEMKTATAPKGANRESRCKDTEKLKVQVENRKKSEVNVNDAEVKKIPLDQTPDLNPAIATANSGPSPTAPEKNLSPTPINRPPNLEAISQVQNPAVNQELKMKKSRCSGIQNHPACEECHTRLAAGTKLNRYPKCTVHRFRRNGETYIDGYTDYSCYCAEEYKQRWRPLTAYE
ncbi:uncharacterized protein F5147DRAFT_776498 [Suillus discolor]|uniref:Uncharacterized protein n=1 Tax=Suillus discolor TaxID=1912936 RepID=A0A9P7JRE2_9AGAM|nr:uncharacterized protein F5147DRAFT_776498 [Suillus discolor]KAG2101840.1 hypothetical protein F5147DRAFT_776498 [Suillus discolor]